MQLRNEALSLSRDIAVNVLGNSWLVDNTERLIVENLGRTVPLAHVGQAFASLEEAQTECDFPVSYLPSRIRVPKGTAFATPGGRTVKGGTTSLFTVDVSDFLNNGILVEQSCISNVEYVRAPRMIANFVDCVTSSIHLSNETPSCVRTLHDDMGQLSVSGSIFVLNGSSWEEYAGYQAFLTRELAVEAADNFALKLVEIANWRKTSSDQRTRLVA